jgi:HEPN/RES N-terminal domain 1
MRCCEACFEDGFLKDFIRKGGVRGSCQYCRARNKCVIDASELEPMFIRFTHLYSPANPGIRLPSDAFGVGEQLATLIQDQWEIFSERLTATERHHDLLNEIFTANLRNEETLDAPEVRDLWVDHDWMHSTLLERWEELANELKYPEQHLRVAPGESPGRLHESCDAAPPMKAADVLLHVMTCVKVRSCSTSCLFRQDHDPFPPVSHGTTVRLTVALLLARLGSGLSAMVAALSVITVPAGAVTFTVRRTVHVVLRAMAPFS